MISKSAARQQATAAALTEMLRIWKDYGLPIPPPDAPLVRFPTHTSLDDFGTPRFSVGFLIRTATSQQPGTILCGYSIITVESGDDASLEKILPDAATARQIFIAGEAGISGINSLLGVAVHCEARGWTDFAGRLLARAVAPPVARPPFYANSYRRVEDAVSLTYRFIWQHLQEEVMRPGSDRKDVAERMKKLLDGGHDLPHGIGKSLHDALTNPARAAAHSAETIIAETLLERLLDSRHDWAAGKVTATDDPYFLLEALGFAAVPTLLKHLDDNRLTSAIAWGFCNSITQQRRVNGLVYSLLFDLAGKTLATKEVPAWWEKARAVGEEAWLVEGAVAKENKSTDWPNACHLRILQLRYPERLADVLLYQLKHRPKAQSHPIISAVEGCKLAGSWKLAVMIQADALLDSHQTSRASLKALADFNLPGNLN